MIRFAVDSTTRTRTATYEGVVDNRELLDAYERLTVEPGYDSSLNDLVDMRALERLDVSALAIRRLALFFAGLDQPHIHNQLAIVAPKDVDFGMARMYEMLRSGSPEQIQVFREMDEARRWLALPAADQASGGAAPGH